MVVGKISEVVIKLRSVMSPVKVLIDHQWVIVGEAIDNVIKLRFLVCLESGEVEVWLGLLSRSNLVCRTGVGTVYRLMVIFVVEVK